MTKFEEEAQLRLQFQKYAFKLFMQQAPDGKHLYTLKDIAKKVNKKVAKSSFNPVTFNAVHKWSLKTNRDGTTWKDCYNKALVMGNSVKKVAKGEKKVATKVAKDVEKSDRKVAKVVPINSAKKNAPPPAPDVSPAMEIEAAAIVGQKIMADAQRRVGETSYVLDFIVKIVNNEIARILREKKTEGKEMSLEDIKKLFTTKGVKFVYDYWRYNIHIVTERLKIEAGEDINDIDEMLEYLETFGD